jgi:hypothetical protein
VCVCVCVCVRVKHIIKALTLLYGALTPCTPPLTLPPTNKTCVDSGGSLIASRLTYKKDSCSNCA